MKDTKHGKITHTCSDFVKITAIYNVSAINPAKSPVIKSRWDDKILLLLNNERPVGLNIKHEHILYPCAR